MAATQTTPPANLMERIHWQLARMALDPEADATTRASHAALRVQFGMNPDQSKPGLS